MGNDATPGIDSQGYLEQESLLYAAALADRQAQRGKELPSCSDWGFFPSLQHEHMHLRAVPNAWTSAQCVDQPAQ